MPCSGRASPACVWDDASPSGFDLDQQHALVDWLHWGGQIIMSGPDTLDTLKGSFLEPYLPAVAAGTREISAADLAEINAFSGKPIRKLSPVKPWSGVKFEKHPQAEFVPNSGELLVERRVGRGRIVVSAFRLCDRDFTTWPGVDEFFNAYLLRHAPRKFVEGDEDATMSARAGRTARSTRIATPRRSPICAISPATTASSWPNTRPICRNRSESPRYRSGRLWPGYRIATAATSADLTNIATVRGPGMAAWNDFSPAAGAAREALAQRRADRSSQADVRRHRAGAVSGVPRAVQLVLLPRAGPRGMGLGRRAGHRHRLHRRGHQTGAVGYRLRPLADRNRRAGNPTRLRPRPSDALQRALHFAGHALRFHLRRRRRGRAAVPHGARSRNRSRWSPARSGGTCATCMAKKPCSQGVPVSSNSTTLMHSEEVFELGGKLSLKRNAYGGYQLDNQTKLKLQGVGLIEKDAVRQPANGVDRHARTGRRKTVGWVPRIGHRGRRPLVGRVPRQRSADRRELARPAT